MFFSVKRRAWVKTVPLALRFASVGLSGPQKESVVDFADLKCVEAFASAFGVDVAAADIISGCQEFRQPRDNRKRNGRAILLRDLGGGTNLH